MPLKLLPRSRSWPMNLSYIESKLFYFVHVLWSTAFLWFRAGKYQCHHWNSILPCVLQGWISRSTFHHLWKSVLPLCALPALLRLSCPNSTALPSPANKEVWLCHPKSSRCVDSHLRPPSFGYRTAADLFHPALGQSLPHPLPADFWVMTWATGEKKECVVSSCCLQGEMLFKFKVLGAAGLLVAWNGRFHRLGQVFQLNSQPFHSPLSG